MDKVARIYACAALGCCGVLFVAWLLLFIHVQETRRKFDASRGSLYESVQFLRDDQARVAAEVRRMQQAGSVGSAPVGQASP